MVNRRQRPTLGIEHALWDSGHEVVVGVDEVGRGAWAGPLTIAAVVLPKDRRVYGVRDSKQLSERRREALFERVRDWCTAVGVGHASQSECDELGMSAAQRLAAGRALEHLGLVPDMVLLDGPWDFVEGANTRTVVKGDATCLSIAAASLVAKVTRDRIMRGDAENFPAYDFERNKGYPSPCHKLALKGYGPTPMHRRSWAFMDNLPWLVRRCEPVGSQVRLFDDGATSPVPTGPTW